MPTISEWTTAYLLQFGEAGLHATRYLPGESAFVTEMCNALDLGLNSARAYHAMFREMKRRDPKWERNPTTQGD